MPCCASAGPIGGAGFALPAVMFSLTTTFSFLAIVISLWSKRARASRMPSHLISQNRASGSTLHFFNLQEIQLDRSFSPKERHHDADFGLVHVDLVDRTHEIVERPVHDAYLLARLEGDFDFGGFGLHALQNRRDFFGTQRGRLFAPAHAAGE